MTPRLAGLIEWALFCAVVVALWLLLPWPGAA
jgi:hypothetical protein